MTEEDPMVNIIIDNIKLHLKEMYENSDKINDIEKEIEKLKKNSLIPLN